MCLNTRTNRRRHANPKQIVSSTLTSYHFIAATPLDITTQYTLHTGRQPPLPDWILSGPIVGYYNGTANVMALHHRFRSLGINITGYWLQDWSGLRVSGKAFGRRAYYTVVALSGKDVPRMESNTNHTHQNPPSQVTPFGTRLWWNWELDDVLYPDFPGMVANLSLDGTRVKQ